MFLHRARKATCCSITASVARRTSLRFIPFGPDQFGQAIETHQVDPGMAATEHMHVGRFVIVSKDDDSQPVGTVDRHHGAA